MCEFLSFFIGATAKNAGEVYAGPPYDSHTGLATKHALQPGEYREAEWTGNGPETLDIRLEPGESADYRSILLQKYPTRQALLESFGKTTCEWADGTRQWYLNGKLHREGDKPAREWADGTKEWWLNGKRQAPPKEEKE